MNISRIVVLALAAGATVAACSEERRSGPVAAAGEPALSFEEADLDKSGDLSTQEAVLVPGLNLLVVDRNRDGTVSREEYQAWTRGDRGTVAGTSGTADATR